MTNTTSRRTFLAGLSALPFCAVNNPSALAAKVAADDFKIITSPRYDADTGAISGFRVYTVIDDEVIFYGSLGDGGACLAVVYLGGDDVVQIHSDATDFGYDTGVSTPGWYITTVVEGQVLSSGLDDVGPFATPDALMAGLRREVKDMFAHGDFGYFNFYDDTNTLDMFAGAMLGVL